MVQHAHRVDGQPQSPIVAWARVTFPNPSLMGVSTIQERDSPNCCREGTRWSRATARPAGTRPLGSGFVGPAEDRDRFGEGGSDRKWVGEAALDDLGSDRRGQARGELQAVDGALVDGRLTKRHSAE